MPWRVVPVDNGVEMTQALNELEADGWAIQNIVPRTRIRQDGIESQTYAIIARRANPEPEPEQTRSPYIGRRNKS